MSGINEGMTAQDMKQREKIVKSMKKNFKDFRNRYGNRAKEVMYATATKMAMKEGHYVHVRTHDNKDDDYISAALKTHNGKSHAPSDKGHIFKFDNMKDADNFKYHVNKNKAIRADHTTNEEVNLTELNKSTITSAYNKRINRLVAVNLDKSLSPENKKILANYHKAKAAKSVTHELVHGHPKVRSLLYKKPLMTSENRVPEEDKGEYDFEGDMAKSSLKTILRNAKMMHDMLGDETNLPEWVQAKITLAEDYIVSAAQYMQNEMNEELEAQGSSVKNIPYDELDMEHLVQDVIKKVAEDDGPHTSKIADTDSPNFQTVVDPVDAVNKQSKLGNVESKLQTAKRLSGKPFKTFRKALRYGIEDLTGAVAGIANEEADPKKVENTTKKKYKEMRSKERHDVRTKEMDNNYPYRSDN